jgi:hypothetical protein
MAYLKGKEKDDSYSLSTVKAAEIMAKDQ